MGQFLVSEVLTRVTEIQKNKYIKRDAAQWQLQFSSTCGTENVVSKMVSQLEKIFCVPAFRLSGYVTNVLMWILKETWKSATKCVITSMHLLGNAHRDQECKTAFSP
jgi:hypothetical protein